MATIGPEALLEQYRWRYATKRFDPERKIPEALWGQIENALVLSPSSYGLQPWKFVVVTDPALKARLRAVSWNQPQIEECSHLVVFTARKGLGPEDIQRYLERIAEVRSVPMESLDGFRDMMLGSLKQPAEALDGWAARQAYLALGFLLASAATLGVDACPMEGIEGLKYDEILGLEGTRTLCVAAVGYRNPEDPYATLAKVRFPKEQVIERR